MQKLNFRGQGDLTFPIIVSLFILIVCLSICFWALIYLPDDADTDTILECTPSIECDVYDNGICLEYAMGDFFRTECIEYSQITLYEGLTFCSDKQANDWFKMIMLEKPIEDNINKRMNCTILLDRN